MTFVHNCIAGGGECKPTAAINDITKETVSQPDLGNWESVVPAGTQAENLITQFP